MRVGFSIATMLRQHAAPAIPVAPTAWSPVPTFGSHVAGWWTASDAATLTMSGSSVSAWASKVGTVVVSQSAAGQRPTYSATGLNGKPAVIFDASDDTLTGTATSNFPTGGNPSTIFGVYQLSAAGAYPYLYWRGGSNFNLMRLLGGANTTGNVGVQTFGGEYNTGVSAVSGPVIVVAQFVQDVPLTYRVSVNGTLLADVTPDGALSTTGTPILVGSGASGAGVTTTEFGELDYLPPTTANRQEIEGGLAWNAGLQSLLPSDHPYKTVCP